MADLLDLFTGSGSLASHTADSGQTWGLLNSTNSTNFATLSGGQAYNSAGTTPAAYCAQYTSASADCAARITVRKGSLSGNTLVGIYLRVAGDNTANPTGYHGRYFEGIGYQMYRVDSPGESYVQVGTDVAGTMADGDVLEFRVTGTGATVTVTLYKNGTQVATAGDTSGSRITTAGKVGLAVWDATHTTGINYKIDAIWAGAATGPSPAPTATLGTTPVAVAGTGTATAANFSGSTATWTSSNTGVATINASTGVYTGVAVGTCTFTATGAAIPQETAVTATLTVSAGGATAFTLTGPSAGPASAASSNFTVTPTGGATSGTFTPTVISGVSYSPATLTWSAANDAKTFTVNKTAAGTISVNGTFSTGETPPSSVSYTAKATTTYTYTVVGGAAATSTTYALKNLDGTDFHAATTTGVADLGGGAYSVSATVPTTYAGTIVWAQGSVLAADTLQPPVIIGPGIVTANTFVIIE